MHRSEHQAVSCPYVVLNPDSGSVFGLSAIALERLFRCRQDLFEEPMSPEDFGVTGLSPVEVCRRVNNALLVGNQLHFLRESLALRTAPELLQWLTSEGDTHLKGAYCRRLVIYPTPVSAEWRIYQEDSGEEYLVSP
jgi:hypothetical protein